MREIKFRAFHKERREYDYSEYGSGGWWGDCVVDCPKDYEPIQQYTGLKDKNGKEIYHFDILSLPMRFHGDHTYKPSIAVMQWEHDGWYVEDQGECGYSEMEIIGNIYENSELLK